MLVWQGCLRNYDTLKSRNKTTECWQKLPMHFPSIELDDYVVMPNHFHGIMIINDSQRHDVALASGGDETSPLRHPTLGRIVGYFKYQSTKVINEGQDTPGVRIWQRNYYDHIIRNDADLHRARTYIRNNPMQWQLDEENPESCRRWFTV